MRERASNDADADRGEDGSTESLPAVEARSGQYEHERFTDSWSRLADSPVNDGRSTPEYRDAAAAR
jgi:hypothetical protein